MKLQPKYWATSSFILAILAVLAVLVSACASSPKTGGGIAPLAPARASSLAPIAPLKTVDVPPTGEANRVTTIGYHIDGTDHYILTWRYRMLGDYNLSLNVDVSDITPIAMHFAESYDPLVNPDCAAAVVDGSGNLTVGVEDITQIAMNYNKRCASYSVQGAAAVGGPYTEVGNAPCPAGAPLADGWPEIAFDLETTPGYEWYQVVPLDTDNNPGIESLPVHIVPGGGGGLVLYFDSTPVSGTGIESDPYVIIVSTAYDLRAEDEHGTAITDGITIYSYPPFFVDVVSASPYGFTATDIMAGDFHVWAETNDGLLTSNSLYFRVQQTLP